MASEGFQSISQDKLKWIRFAQVMPWTRVRTGGTRYWLLGVCWPLEYIGNEKKLATVYRNVCNLKDL